MFAFEYRVGGYAKHTRFMNCPTFVDMLDAWCRSEEALRHVQGFFRQSVQSIEDLHASVMSAWPLYGILHAATLALNGARG